MRCLRGDSDTSNHLGKVAIEELLSYSSCDLEADTLMFLLLDCGDEVTNCRPNDRNAAWIFTGTYNKLVQGWRG
jgi:hypothetical protein